MPNSTRLRLTPAVAGLAVILRGGQKDPLARDAAGLDQGSNDRLGTGLSQNRQLLGADAGVGQQQFLQFRVGEMLDHSEQVARFGEVRLLVDRQR